MKSLVLGAAGFVGGYLIEELKKSGKYDVTATKLSFEKLNIDGVKVIDVDICDIGQIKQVIRELQPDVIFHLAAQSSVKKSWEKPQLTVEINVLGAVNLFEAVRAERPAAKVIVIGSSEEYGDIDYSVPVKETVAPNPKNIYALTKRTQEELARIYCQAYGLDIVMTRSFNHIGPKQLPQFVVADFCSQVAKIEKGLQSPEIRVGNLAARRDFTDVRDVVKAYMLLAEKGIKGEIYNVGSGVSVEISKILKYIISLSNKRISVKIDEAKMRPIDIPDIKADVRKLFSLGWTKNYDIKQTIKETLDYFRKETL